MGHAAGKREGSRDLKAHFQKKRSASCEEDARTFLPQDLQRARAVQDAFAPRPCPDCAHMPIALRKLMRKGIGGDFHQFTRPDLNRRGFLIGDATGFGVASAMVTALIYGLTTHLAREVDSPSQLLSELNRALFELNSQAEGKLDLFSATVFYSSTNVVTGELSFANAGHVPPLVVPPCEEAPVLLEPTGPPLGFFPSWPGSARVMRPQEKSKLVLYTDGLVEAQDHRGDSYGLHRWAQFLSARRNLEGARLADEAFREVAEYVGPSGFRDDVTLMVVDFAFFGKHCGLCVSDRTEPVAEAPTSSG